jgi:hypothetical protein
MAINFTSLATNSELKNQDLIARGAALRGGLTPTGTQQLQVVPLSGETPNPENPEQPPSVAIPEGAFKDIGYRDLNKKEIILKYPENMSQDQDNVQFSVWEYDDRSLSRLGQEIVISGVGGNREDKKYKKVEKTPYVVLPITKISDTNSVDFQDDFLNELQRVAANASLSFMNSDTPFDLASLGSLDSTKDLFTKNSPATTAIKVFLAGQAVQVNNLLTRSTGAILNNNIELLFRGPQLRQFSFAFDLFSKDNTDATAIKNIIYFFKSRMAVRDNIGELGQLGSSDFSAGVFLNSPYLFKIKYMRGRISNSTTPIESKEHQSIGKIKMCALQSCTVDYTPMGTYMTFNDEEATMVMYRLTLQFKELTPIYASDYQSDHPIGY